MTGFDTIPKDPFEMIASIWDMITTAFMSVVGSLWDFYTMLNNMTTELTAFNAAGSQTGILRFLGAFRYVVGDYMYSCIFLIITAGIYYAVFKLILFILDTMNVGGFFGKMKGFLKL